MILKTPSGYEVNIKDSLTYGQMRELQRVLFEGMKMEAGSSTMPQIDFGKLLDYADKAFPFVVTKIVKDGKEIEGDLYQFVMNMDMVDGDMIFEAIGKVAQFQSKKK